MREAVSFPGGPRFYYGPAKSRKPEIKGHQFCLLDLKSRLCCRFDYPVALGDAIAMLVRWVGGEENDYRVFRQPMKRIESEIRADEHEDCLEEQDVLSDRNQEDSALSLCDPLMTALANLKKSSDETDNLFAEKEDDEQTLVLQVEEVFVPKVLPMGNPHGAYAAPALDHQDACELRELSELESEDTMYGPFFSEASFTDDLVFVPPGLIALHGLIDLKSNEAQATNILREVEAIKDEVTIAFHPERAYIMKKERGLAGFGNIESRETETNLADIKSRR